MFQLVSHSQVGDSGHAFSVCLDLVYQYSIKVFNFLSLLRSALLALRHLDAQFSNFIKDEAYPLYSKQLILETLFLWALAAEFLGNWLIVFMLFKIFVILSLHLNGNHRLVLI